MKLGISSYTYTWSVGFAGSTPERPLTVFDLLDRASKMGVRVLQICDNLPLDRLSSRELESFASTAQECGIEIEVGTRGIAPETLRTYIELAKRLDSKFVRTVADTATHKPTEDEIVSGIGAFVPELERAGLCIALENHDRLKARTLAGIIERIGSPSVGICLDTTNSFGASEGPEVVVETLGPLAINVHLKDYVAYRPSQLMGFIIEGRPVGQGQLDIPWLLGKLREFGRDPNVILELWTSPEDTLAATMAKHEAWAATSVECMRRFIKD